MTKQCHIVTKTGDLGETSLLAGLRVSKSSPRVCCYGEVDELNSTIGLALALQCPPQIADELKAIQRELFALGADLADHRNPEEKQNKPRITEQHVAVLEGYINAHLEQMPKTMAFIVPGGLPGAAALHVCRTVCRRAERAAVSLAASEYVAPSALVYLNRLSDYFYVAARMANIAAGHTEEVL